MGQSPPAQPTPGPNSSVTIPLQIAPGDLGNVPKDKVLIQVNDIKITVAQFDMILKAYPENTRAFVLGPGRQQFFDNLVRTLVLSEEGKRRKLEDDPTYQALAQYSLAAILANQTTEDIRKNARVDDAALKKYLDKHECEYTKLKARHILVRAKGSPVPVRAGQPDLSEPEALAKAKDLRMRIQSGADFAELARTESDDVGTGAQGGDMGVFGHGQVAPSIEDAACQLKSGEVSEPVKSPLGFHLIQVQERQIKSLDELRPELEPKVRVELTKDQVEALINKAKVILAPEVLPASKLSK
jgi:parvulin-like peptidyl-prolyl isomerase